MSVILSREDGEGSRSRRSFASLRMTGYHACVGDFLEAVVLLLPPDAGGRTRPIAPREGTYRPIVGSMQARFIEGPPTIAPGYGGRVVIELESAPEDQLAPGCELPIVEDERAVGILTVTRVWRSTLAV